MIRLFLAALLGGALLTAHAQETDTRAAQAAAAQLEGSLNFMTGEYKVAQANATLELSDEFRYLTQTDARRVLEQLWGNPPDESVLGLVVPANTSLLEEHSWAVVLTYSDDGHVTDEDAAGTDYDELLGELQEATRADNEARREAGYPAVELVGWAAPPRYDAATKKLHWAKELSFDGGNEHTLNYDIRVLGREGYLSMNAIANLSDRAKVSAGMEKLLGMTRFDEGHRYADFNEGTDKLAGYGVAALIGGAIASKAGLFAKLGALLIAGKKLIIPIVIAIGALLSRLFKKKEPAQS
jgi:uncharacterized membrane-anchored protein